MIDKIKGIIEKEYDTKEVIKGDFLKTFKHIGEYKTINTLINLKPDLIVYKIKGQKQYVFIVDDLFECFKVLSKILLLKQSSIFLESKEVIFYVKNNVECFIKEEKGFLVERRVFDSNNLKNEINGVIKFFEIKLDMKIDINNLF